MLRSLTFLAGTIGVLLVGGLIIGASPAILLALGAVEMHALRKQRRTK